MNQQQLRSGSKDLQGKVGPSGWWLGLGLALAAAVVIAIAVYVSAPPAASPRQANAIANGAARVETNDQRAHADPSFHAAQTATYGRLHDDPSFHAPQVPYHVPLDQSFHVIQTAKPAAVDPSLPAQSVPDAGDQGVMNYVRVHGFAGSRQTVPNAGDQGIMNYVRAHGFGASNQIVADAADQGEMNYLRAHGVVIAPPSAADYLRVPNSVRASHTR